MALLIALHATHQLDSDEGLILHGAWSILNGRTLYTDFFEYVAPGSFYLIAFVWKLLGVHFWVAKLTGIVAIAVAAVGVYRISLLVWPDTHSNAPHRARLFALCIFCLSSGYWPAVNHNTFSIALMVWRTYFSGRSLLQRSTPAAAIGGLLCGIAIVFLQHRGTMLAATTVAAFLVLQYRDKGGSRWECTVAFVVATLLPVVVMLLIWPAGLLIENLIHFPATRYLAVNRLDPTLFILVAMILLLAAWLLRHRSSRIVWYLMSLQAVLFMSALQRPDPSHITPILFPLLALLPLLANAVAGTPLIPKLLLAWIVAALLLMNGLVPIAVAVRPATSLFEVSQHPALQYVRRNCTASPYIYAGPFVPGYYFETAKLNPTRHSFLLTEHNTSSHFMEAARDIAARHPQCVVTNYSAVEKFNYNRNNPVDEYIATNYEVAYQLGRVQVWKARSHSASTP